MTINGKMFEKALNIRRAEFQWMSQLVKSNETAYPSYVRLLCPRTEVAQPQIRAQARQ